MNNDIDGGQAFPSMTVDKYGESDYLGMSMRAYFAAHAPEVPPENIFPRLAKEGVLEGRFENGNTRKLGFIYENELERLIRWRWAYADMMIEEGVQ